MHRNALRWLLCPPFVLRTLEEAYWTACVQVDGSSVYTTIHYRYTKYVTNRGALGTRGLRSVSTPSTFSVLEADTTFFAAFRARATARTPSTSVTDLGLIDSLNALASLLSRCQRQYWSSHQKQVEMIYVFRLVQKSRESGFGRSPRELQGTWLLRWCWNN